MAKAKVVDERVEPVVDAMVAAPVAEKALIALREIAELPHKSLTVPDRPGGCTGLGAGEAIKAAKIARRALGYTELVPRSGTGIHGIEWV